MPIVSVFRNSQTIPQSLLELTPFLASGCASSVITVAVPDDQRTLYHDHYSATDRCSKKGDATS